MMREAYDRPHSGMSRASSNQRSAQKLRGVKFNDSVPATHVTNVDADYDRHDVEASAYGIGRDGGPQLTNSQMFNQ